MLSGRSYSEFLSRCGISPAESLDLGDRVIPVVVVDQAAHLADPLHQGNAFYQIWWVGAALTHVGWRVRPGPRGTWIRRLEHTSNAEMNWAIWPGHYTTGGTVSDIGPAGLWGPEPRHRCERVQWDTANLPSVQRQTVDPTAVPMRTHGARDTLAADFFIEPGSEFVGWHVTVNQWIHTGFWLADVP